MADLLAGDDKNRDLTYDEAYRWYLITRSDPPGDYRFGRMGGKRLGVRACTALRRVNGCLKNMIEAIASCAAWSASLNCAVFDSTGRTTAERRANPDRSIVHDEEADHPAHQVLAQLWIITCREIRSPHPLSFPACAMPSAPC